MYRYISLILIAFVLFVGNVYADGDGGSEFVNVDEDPYIVMEEGGGSE